MSVGPPDPGAATHHRVIAAAAALLAEGGPEAVSTRAVSAAAGVQAPAIYRLFGHKQGLLDAVATDGFHAYVAAHRRRMSTPAADAVDGLRRGWDAHVSFGLAHPHVYALVYGRPEPGVVHPAVESATTMLRDRVRRVDDDDRLTVTVEEAVRLISAAACGTTLALLGMGESERELGLSDLAREAVIRAITTDSPGATSRPTETTARRPLESLARAGVLSPGEQALLQEWLDRVVTTDGHAPAQPPPGR